MLQSTDRGIPKGTALTVPGIGMASEHLRATLEILDEVLRRLISGTQAEAHRVQILQLLPELLRGFSPRASFDPADPKVAARMAALALLMQPKAPLSNVAPAYGSGIFAIYYEGAHPLYAPIAGSETPIYVGRVHPAYEDASTIVEQGTRLTERLSALARSIASVETYSKSRWPDRERIELCEFQYRRLVCATHAQLVAEKYLIRVLCPLWNPETEACWGLSKHDAGRARVNERSPWDVAHPGRQWALSNGMRDALTPGQIGERIAMTLKKCPPQRDRAALFQELIGSLFQSDSTLAGQSI